MSTTFKILIASPDMHRYYQPDKLDNNDQVRAIQFPSCHQRQDWRVSRFLKQTLSSYETAVSLSHKQGYACLIATHHSYNQMAGIDIELIKERDFTALASLCMSTTEQQWLSAHAHPKLAFYQLWSLKEAWIKLNKMQLSDMPHINLIPDTHLGIRIPATTVPLHAYSTQLNEEFIISCIYPSTWGELSDKHIHYYGLSQPQCVWSPWST